MGASVVGAGTGGNRPAVTVDQVTKRYRNVTALDRVSFSLPFGTCSALVGPNGAGKTTILRILSGLVRRFEGDATIDGRSVRGDRPPVGAIVERPAFYPYLSVVGNLRHFAALCGIPDRRVDEMVELLGLQGVTRRKAGVLSHGMRQRLGLALSLLTSPRVLLLDEPMTGLDPAAQHEFRGMLEARIEKGDAVVVSSHNLAEVEALADTLVFLKRGRVVAAGAKERFLQDGTLSIQIDRAEQARRVIEAAGYEVLSVRQDEILVRWSAEARGEGVARVLADAGLYPRSMHASRASLESVYLHLMGGG